MRNAFVKRLSEFAERDRRVMLVTGDLGFGVLDEFERRFPDQYLNVGVAEQNMTAVATGLALEGHVVFTYSIGNFPTLRCLEQLRNDTFYHQANVKVVSVGGGFSYGQLGMSHHATEDLSILRAIPGVVVCAPGSAFETRCLVDSLMELNGPAYLRLERGAGDFHDDESVLCEIGKARSLREGRDCTLLTSGGVLSEVSAAAKILAEGGIESRVISMHTLKPLDAAAVLAAAEQTDAICTVEENVLNGGLGSAVAELCMDTGHTPRRFKRIGLPDRFTTVVGDQSYLRRLAGLDRHGIAQSVRALLES